MLLGVGGAVTDLAAVAGAHIPRLSYAGFLAQSLLLAALVFKAPLFERPTILAAVNSLVVAVLALLAQLLVFAWAGQRPAVLLFGTLVVVLGLSAALRPLWQLQSEQRARARHHAALGRLSRQMAHDIRNPLAAIRGAAQFLQEEHRQGRPLEPHVQFLDMIVERSQRLEGVVADYQRIARVEPVVSDVDVNALVQAALDAARVAVEPGVEIASELEQGLPPCPADRDLVTHALENLVRNAIEAMPEGGHLTLVTRLSMDPLFAKVDLGQGQRTMAEIQVADEGQGIPEATRQRLFTPFFTTKDRGLGLGLALCHRIVEEHKGAIQVASEPGRGTAVSCFLPIAK
jgi:signal transduction histidine kinase